MLTLSRSSSSAAARHSPSRLSQALANLKPAATAIQFQPRADTSQLQNRGIQSTRAQAAFRPTWMPMRVKTPWIDALNQSRENAQTAQGQASQAGQAEGPRAQPDLTPKRMADSYYSAVCSPQ